MNYDRPIREEDFAYAIGLVRKVCRISGQHDLIAEIRTSFAEIGLLDAIRHRDTDMLFDWFAEAISYQGISDHVAAGYIEQHGIAGAWHIRDGLRRTRLCPKLAAYWTFEACGYRKGAGSCNEPSRIGRCPLPRHDLRNGSLNQASYSLYLFLRDVADWDLVGWLDRRLAGADDPRAPDRDRLLREAVVGPLRHIHSVSDKLLNMVLASLLLAGDQRRKRWQRTGASMIVIDSLVHNWLHRTGILGRFGADHPYGPGCYGPDGCEVVVRCIAQQIDARDFNPGFPQFFPRFVQKALWSFCAASGLNICNGNRIDDRARCDNDACPLSSHCGRVTLTS